MAEEKIISIITINYNGLKDTYELMDTLPLDDTSIEVIVVDNASREDEASVIQQRYPQVKVIRSKQNLGFAGGNNLGIEASCGKYLYFINNDTLLHLPWGKKAVRIAIAIGQDADNEVLEQFTGNKELVLQANNPQALVKMIKWASTAASMVSAPASRPNDMIDLKKDSPATNADLMLDMNNIPDTDEVDADDVW